MKLWSLLITFFDSLCVPGAPGRLWHQDGQRQRAVPAPFGLLELFELQQGGEQGDVLLLLLREGHGGEQHHQSGCPLKLTEPLCFGQAVLRQRAPGRLEDTPRRRVRKLERLRKVLHVIIHLNKRYMYRNMAGCSSSVEWASTNQRGSGLFPIPCSEHVKVSLDQILNPYFLQISQNSYNFAVVHVISYR